MKRFIWLLGSKYSNDIKSEEDLCLTFRELNVDSLQIVALICEIEEIYQIQFSVEELDDMEDLMDLYKCIEKKSGDKSLK